MRWVDKHLKRSTDAFFKPQLVLVDDEAFSQVIQWNENDFHQLHDSDASDEKLATKAVAEIFGHYPLCSNQFPATPPFRNSDFY